MKYPPRIYALLAAVAAVAMTASSGSGLARDAKPKVEILLSTGKTVLGQPLAYPAGADPRVTAAIVTLLPGQETGWHSHRVPLFGSVLEGEILVDYGRHGMRRYKPGDSLMEAVTAPHNGRNETTRPVRLLVVFMGVAGTPNTEREKAPRP